MPESGVVRSIPRRSSLGSVPALLGACLALLVLSPVALAGDGLSSLKVDFRKETDAARRVTIIEDMAALVSDGKDTPRNVAKAMEPGLLDKDPTVALRTVELLRRGGLEEFAEPALKKALGKLATRHKTFVVAMDKNFAIFDKMIDEIESIRTQDEIDAFITKINQFLEATGYCFEQYDLSARLLAEISESLLSHPGESSANALKSAMRKVHKYSPVDSVPVMECLVRLGSRSSVGEAVELLEDYSFKKDQIAAKKFFNDSLSLRDYSRGGMMSLDREWIDWGKRYHDALSEVARSLDPDIDIPRHGHGTPEFWSEWFDANQERLPSTPTDDSIVPASGELEDDEDDDDEDW